LRLQEQLIQRRITIQAQTRTRLQGQLSRSQRLEQRGLISRVALEDVETQIDAAKTELVLLHQQLGELTNQAAALQREREREQWRLEQERTKAMDQKRRAEFLLEQTVIRAPQSGIVEALRVKPDDVVQAGNIVGKLVPDGVPQQVTAFIAEKDRAFLQLGASIRLEIDGLPSAEFGTIQGIITQIATDFTSTQDIRALIGDGPSLNGSHLRVDITLDTTDPHLPKMRPYLRSGAQLTAHFALRKRRILALVLAPLRRWLEGV
ncbi:MAG: hypothetical protein ETSY1_46315, partial (plasmid) [Candidatus Entotheonella factor]